ncbi:MAG: crt 3 [Gammaproteobacteria bacterium]|jgi:enoyl-CoA hydratase/carnithine racemase|nr:crt 3 [Gammaproteobacteria bacterium]
MQNQEILFEVLQGAQGGIGLITLNRPQALNALTKNMCVSMYQQLHTWKEMDEVKAVVVRGAGERAFCAGGDIRMAYENRNDISNIESFFAHEYRLNTFIYHYPKPYIALMDGITMGGGLGISVQASHRIATERSIFAMPETGIGLFPDVGASYFLPRLKEKTGWYLGLAGVTIDVSDAIYTGLADVQIDSKSIENFLMEMKNIDWREDANTKIQSLISSFKMPNLASKLSQMTDMLNQAFSAQTMEEILLRLKNDESSEAKEIYELLLTRSPTSLKVTLASLQRGQNMTFDACMEMNRVMIRHFLKGNDFYEGVRAMLIDKDKNPQWRPAAGRLDEVSESEVSGYFI